MDWRLGRYGPGLHNCAWINGMLLCEESKGQWVPSRGWIVFTRDHCISAIPLHPTASPDLHLHRKRAFLQASFLNLRTSGYSLFVASSTLLVVLETRESRLPCCVLR